MNAEKRNGELALSDAPRSLVGRDTKIFVVVANSCVMSWASHFLLRQRRDVGVNSKLMIHFLPNLFEKSPWRQLRSRPPSVRIRVRPLLKIRGLTMSAVRVVRRQSPAVTTFAPRTRRRRRRRRRPPPHDTALLLLAARPPPPLFPSLPPFLPPCRSRRAGGAVVSFARVNKLTFQNTSGGEDLATSQSRERLTSDTSRLELAIHASLVYPPAASSLDLTVTALPCSPGGAAAAANCAHCAYYDIPTDRARAIS